MLIETTEYPIRLCYLCDKLLEARYDYMCPMCFRPVCDDDSQICQMDDCDMITCFGCVERYLDVWHTSDIESRLE